MLSVFLLQSTDPCEKARALAVSRSALHCRTVVQEGTFGRVYRGSLSQAGREQEVIIKTVTGTLSAQQPRINLTLPIHIIPVPEIPLTRWKLITKSRGAAPITAFSGLMPRNFRNASIAASLHLLLNSINLIATPFDNYAECVY